MFWPFTSTDPSLDTFRQHYSIRSKLGKGTFGVIFNVISKKNQLKRTAKIIKHIRHQDVVIIADKPMPIEIYALQRVRGHPCIVNYIEHQMVHNTYVIITEHLPCYTDLYRHITTKGKLSEGRTRTVIQQVIQALEHCFKHGIDHRDIKEENIMYNAQSEKIKLIDFGSASLTASAPYRYARGTEYYVPPEYHLHRLYYPSPAASWAVGCLTYCCLTATTPFLNTHQILHEEVQYVGAERCRQFVMGCLRKKEGCRLRFEGLKNHPWLQPSTERYIATTL